MAFSTQILHQICLLAQEAAEGGGAAEQPGLFDVFGVPVMVMIAIYVVLVMLPQNKERKGRQDFLSNLKKNDQVVTIGGVFGTVTGFSADGTQVTLRVDENTRIRVRKSSIESIVKTEGEEKPA
ncbi:preprotein translocase subunit YajC [Rubinisphaera italica]|uniref:Sec translocon accessory complex subunit YajC n=1 Tax=Rubinisphaera italica TaxID=2527969 RepID=A0A5C5XLP7_9PLAN|nr:preprotein translocase subunit YajC [Rubinisphaera italica]TWT63469.1 preprotein translocase subunit YajC [Rubinisphaera italica]HBN74239.1 preprotein translocase subunit YajC [Planctomycetaceae bacterium]